MYVFGITGGVGAGKSEILSYLKKAYPVRILLTDELAKELMQPGYACHERLYEAFQQYDVFDDDRVIVKEALAKLIFSDDTLRTKLNAIVHPAVKEEVIRQVELEKAKKRYAAFYIEAALVIEEGYGAFCDDLWYVYTKEAIRRERLKASRGYSDEKIDAIMKSQLPEETFLEHCGVVIDNNKNLEEVKIQIDEIMQNKYSIHKKEGDLA